MTDVTDVIEDLDKKLSKMTQLQKREYLTSLGFILAPQKEELRMDAFGAKKQTEVLIVRTSKKKGGKAVKRYVNQALKNADYKVTAESIISLDKDKNTKSKIMVESAET